MSPATIRALLAALLLATPAACRLAAQNAPPQNPAGQVIGVGGFTHIVSDLDRALKFYVEAMGLELIRPVPAFGMPDWIRRMAGTPAGAVSRPANLRIPNSQLGVELIEYKDVERHPIRPRPEDPGASTLVLTVRDMDKLVAALERAGGRTLTKICALGCMTTMVDPDGFYVAVAESLAPPAGPPPESNIIGASFGIIVADLDATVKLYREALGFNVAAQNARATASIPGTQVRMTWVESKRGTTMRSRVPDPGTPILQLQVRDAHAAVRALKAAGAEIVSEGGVVLTDSGAAFLIVRDPNNLFLELFQGP
jgi:catechol 2,3-dioxygenase-like lactoylglutathione lyase family enzyme